jgi:hypothetical protein
VETSGALSRCLIARYGSGEWTKRTNVSLAPHCHVASSKPRTSGSGFYRCLLVRDIMFTRLRGCAILERDMKRNGRMKIAVDP